DASRTSFLAGRERPPAPGARARRAPRPPPPRPAAPSPRARVHRARRPDRVSEPRLRLGRDRVGAAGLHARGGRRVRPRSPPRGARRGGLSVSPSHRAPMSRPAAAPFDVVVVGAGPAGSSASIVLARGGRRVLLLEKARFPRPKVCGEFLSPDAVSSLRTLGVLAAVERARPERIARGSLHWTGGRSVWFDLAEHALGISR